MTKDLTTPEAIAEMAELMREMHRDAYASAGLNLSAHFKSRGLLQAHVSPLGVTARDSFFVFGNTWRELIANVRDEWTKRADLTAANTIRAMALKIIAITADRGECTDSALRADFDSRDVLRYAEAAAEQANELAAGGPFTVVKMSGANDLAASKWARVSAHRR